MKRLLILIAFIMLAGCTRELSSQDQPVLTIRYEDGTEKSYTIEECRENQEKIENELERIMLQKMLADR